MVQQENSFLKGVLSLSRYIPKLILKDRTTLLSMTVDPHRKIVHTAFKEMLLVSSISELYIFANLSQA